MDIKKGTAAHRAYTAGRNAFAQGFDIDRNPYTTRSQLSLKIRWEQGYNELKEQMQGKKIPG